MSRKAVKERKGEAPPSWAAPAERAPSVIREEEPTLARLVGFVGLLLLATGTAALLASHLGWRSRVGPGWGVVFFMTGLCGLLYHAAADRDLQYRRTYGVFGVAWLLAGAVFSLVPVEDQVAALFLPYGAGCFAIGLFFLLPFSRNETDPQWLNLTANVLGGLGAVLALTGFIGGNVSADFLVTKGLPLIVLGLAFAWAYVGQVGSATERGYRAGVALGVVGGLAFLVALGRSFLPHLFYALGWSGGRPEPFLVPQGLFLMILELVYVGMALGVCSENRLVVLTRRELASFFYSPIAYIVFFGLAAVGWYRYLRFLNLLLFFSDPRRMAPADQDLLIEPVVSLYVMDWYTIIAVIFVVPVLTMRLLSEEKRTGTLEVLFTAPVREVTVVLSKFIAALVVFLLAWVPWALFLVALRAEGGREFDYRPMLSFFLALFCTGAAFVSLGLFFSSVTRSQIASAVLTFVGLMLVTAVYFLKGRLQQNAPDSTWNVVLTYVSYIDLWVRSMEGTVIPRYLLFYVSLTVFWLYVTVKVLEARKWR